MASWTPTSWRGKPSQQMAEYEDKAAAAAVFAKLGKLPPLVQPAEVDRLRTVLAAAANGERFIVQGGDCAERFIDCEADRLEAQLKLLLQMGAIVAQSTGLPSVNIARIAGQYGKPRSKPTEMHATEGEIMSFKGDNINGYAVKDRKWDSARLLEGYYHSSATLNYLCAALAALALTSPHLTLTLTLTPTPPRPSPSPSPNPKQARPHHRGRPHGDEPGEPGRPRRRGGQGGKGHLLVQALGRLRRVLHEP